jgi:hypothetical protein
MAAMTTSLAPGQIFAKRYEVVRCIGSGGMGAVYEVIHLETERRRALKVMHAHFADSPDFRERFKREARVAAQIDSDYIVDVFDAGVDDATKMPFLAMELLRGEEVARTLRRIDRMSPPEVVSCLHQTALALDRTHKAGIVHRDLKPENLFLCERDDGPPQIKVLDFGIAKFATSAKGGAGQATNNVGTPLYMAPEQFQQGTEVTPLADVYALGLLAYTLLVGTDYWHEELERDENVFSFALIAMKAPIENASSRALRVAGITLSPAFDAWFKRVTAFTPEARYATATETVRELARALAVNLHGGIAARARHRRDLARMAHPRHGASLARDPRGIRDDDGPAGDGRAEAPLEDGGDRWLGARGGRSGVDAASRERREPRSGVGCRPSAGRGAASSAPLRGAPRAPRRSAAPKSERRAQSGRSDRARRRRRRREDARQSRQSARPQSAPEADLLARLSVAVAWRRRPDRSARVARRRHGARRCLVGRRSRVAHRRTFVEPRVEANRIESAFAHRRKNMRESRGGGGIAIVALGGVMQKHDRAIAKSRRDAPRDLARIGTNPVATAHRPTDDGEPQIGGDPRVRRIGLPHRGTVEPRARAGRFFQRLDRTRQIGPHAGGRPHRKKTVVTVAVHTDEMPARCDLADHLRMFGRLFTDDEESRPRASPFESVEDRARPLWVRAVVERQCDPVRPFGPLPNDVREHSEGRIEHPPGDKARIERE